MVWRAVLQSPAVIRPGLSRMEDPACMSIEVVSQDKRLSGFYNFADKRGELVIDGDKHRFSMTDGGFSCSEFIFTKVKSEE